MCKKIKVLISFGTRPEAIKMAPLVKLLKNDDRFQAKVLVTAQHRDMLDQVLSVFKITPDFDMDLMQPNQSLTELGAQMLLGFNNILANFKPDIVLVHGDTLSANFIAQSAFLNKIDIAHIEAGLRTNNLFSPWPEEANRQIISRISKFHFSPTNENKKNLIKENIPASSIFVVGNTVIDSLLHIASLFPDASSENSPKRILITSHRRENFGQSFENICQAIKEIATARQDVAITFPVHKNPYVQEIAYKTLQGINNITLIDPLSYTEFVKLMKNCYFILTDSGGIQEEAPSLGKPVLVMRDTTERHEALAAGTVKLIGSDFQNIINSVYELLDNDKIYKQMSNATNPYGNGQSAKKIIEILAENYY